MKVRIVQPPGIGWESRRRVYAGSSRIGSAYRIREDPERWQAKFGTTVWSYRTQVLPGVFATAEEAGNALATAWLSKQEATRGC